MGLRGHNQKKQYPHCEKARRKDKGTESIFKAITAENLPSLGREMDIQIDEV